MNRTLLYIALVLTSGVTMAQEGRDRIQLDETVISGNQELPKVLYILPWRDPDGLPELELETDLVESEVFRRIYPPAYRRELDYLNTLNGASGAADTERK